MSLTAEKIKETKNSIEGEYIKELHYMREVIDILIYVKRLHTKNNNIDHENVLNLLIARFDDELSDIILSRLKKLLGNQKQLKEILINNNIFSEIDKLPIQEMENIKEVAMDLYNIVYKIRTKIQLKASDLLNFILNEEEKELALKNIENIKFPETPTQMEIKPNKIKKQKIIIN